MTGARTPIAIFCFNRPVHLRRTLASLMECEGFQGSPVYVFCDGPRREEDSPRIIATRSVAKEMLGPAVEYRFAKKNKGLAQSITDGVSELTQSFGRVIVVEDDLELSPGFLAYMNASLDHFENDPKVMQVSGHMFNVPEFIDRGTAMLLPLTTTWGWATWHRAWKSYDASATGWEALLQDRHMRKTFNLGGGYDYSTMLKRQMRQNLDSWGIRWYWSVFRRGGLGLFPPQSLVKNHGMDGTGTHGRGIFADFSNGASDRPRGCPAMPDQSVVSQSGLKAVQKAIWKQNGGWCGRALSKTKSLLRS